MYLEIALLVILILPLPIMAGVIKDGGRPFKTVAYGAVAAAAGVLAIFVAAYFAGHNISEYLDKAIANAVDIVQQSPQAMDTLGLGDISAKEAEQTLTQMYSSVISFMPSAFLILAAAVSYIEYNILVRIKFRGKDQIKPFAYMRDFSLRPNDVIGWFLIYLVSYLLKAMDIGAAASLVLNINALVQAIVSLQGISLIFVFFYVRRINRIVPFIASAILWMMPLGRTVLFVLGVMDLLMNMRGRMNKETEKRS